MDLDAQREVQLLGRFGQAGLTRRTVGVVLHERAHRRRVGPVLADVPVQPVGRLHSHRHPGGQQVRIAQVIGGQGGDGQRAVGPQLGQERGDDRATEELGQQHGAALHLGVVGRRLGRITTGVLHVEGDLVLAADAAELGVDVVEVGLAAGR